MAFCFFIFWGERRCATQDVDFASAIEYWEKFAGLVRGIFSRPKFQALKIEHRVFFKPLEAQKRIPVDIVPFGGVAAEENKIFWPGDSHIVMSVAGLDDTIAGAVWVRSIKILLFPSLCCQDLCSEATLRKLSNLFSLPDTMENLENQITDRGFQTEETTNRTASLLQAFLATLTAIK